MRWLPLSKHLHLEWALKAMLCMPILSTCILYSMYILYTSANRSPASRISPIGSSQPPLIALCIWVTVYHLCHHRVWSQWTAVVSINHADELSVTMCAIDLSSASCCAFYWSINWLRGSNDSWYYWLCFKHPGRFQNFYNMFYIVKYWQLPTFAGDSSVELETFFCLFWCFLSLRARFSSLLEKKE